MATDPITGVVLIAFYVTALIAFRGVCCVLEMLWTGLRTLSTGRRRRRPFPRTLVNVDLKDL